MKYFTYALIVSIAAAAVTGRLDVRRLITEDNKKRCSCFFHMNKV